MNEGENTGMPTSPDFSSPNTPPENPTPIQPATPPDPSQVNPVASVYSAAASLPAEDPSQPAQTISSGKPSARPHFGFSRKFKDQQSAQPRTNAFKNTPDFFNQAVGDIVVADENAAVKKQKTKKIVIIAVAALVVLGGVLAAVLLVSQANKPSANRVKAAFNRYANYVLYGEEKDSEIGELDESKQYEIMSKYIKVDTSFNDRFKELFDAFYKEYNDAAKNGLYKKGEMDTYRGIVHDVYNSFDMDSNYNYDDIVNLYKTYGATIIGEQLQKKYESYKSNSDSQLSENWYQARMAISRAVEIYNGNKCAYLGRGNWSCDVDISKNSELKEAIASTKEHIENEKRLYENARINIWRSVWTARDYIRK